MHYPGSPGSMQMKPRSLQVFSIRRRYSPIGIGETGRGPGSGSQGRVLGTRGKSSEEGTSDHFPQTMAVQVYLLLRETYTLADKVINADFSILGLSSAHYAVLRYLDSDEAIPLSELSRRLTKGKSNLTTIIPRMERKGLVETVSLPGDKRYSLVRLSDAGRNLRDQVVPAHRRLLEAMVRRLSATEQEQFVYLISEINRGLHEIRRENVRTDQEGTEER